jgi:hypothetical protein
MQVVVSFQGSSELLDWINNARFLPVPNEPSVEGHHEYRSISRGNLIRTSQKQPGWMHQGFKEIWQSVEAAVFAVVDRVTGKDPWWSVYTTGHSLGGALSTAAAEAFATRHPKYVHVSNCTFAFLRSHVMLTFPRLQNAFNSATWARPPGLDPQCRRVSTLVD